MIRMIRLTGRVTNVRRRLGFRSRPTTKPGQDRNPNIQRIPMAEHSTIEWTDSSWNPIRGCTKISPGCAHCYAETFAERFRGVPGHPYEQGFDLRLVPDQLHNPLLWPKPRIVQLVGDEAEVEALLVRV